MTTEAPRNLPHPAGEATVTPSWHPLTRVAFRAVFVWFALTLWLWLDEVAINPTWLVRKIYPVLTNHMVALLARLLLHTSAVYKPNSFRDTHYLYLALLGYLLLTVLGTAAWSVLDRERREYTQLHRWLRVLLRYSLAYFMLLYGMDKVIKLQFPAPPLSRLIENYGDSSPMALMWTFMGYSTVYTVFSGSAEVLSALLLLFRRTTLMGALLAFAVMVNVTVMDFCYDVSVKMVAVNLVLIAAMLILPDARRLADVLVFNRTAPPGYLARLPAKPEWRWGYLALKTLVVLYLLVPLTYRTLKTYSHVGPDAPKAPLYGLYKVSEFRLDGSPVPALLDKSARWRYVAVESADTLYVKHMDDSLTKYAVHYDAKTHEATVQSADPLDSGAKSAGDLTATREPDGGLELAGPMDGHGLDVVLTPVDPHAFLLNRRGFHWISESSFFK